jgi:hypothetical protein
LDDVDRLFARLEPIEPPADLLGRVATATRALEPAGAPDGRRGLWLALDAAAIVLLAVVSLWLGMELDETGALDLIGLLLVDTGAMGEGLGALLEALLQALPWPQLALLGANLVVIVALSQLALGRDPRTARVGS